MLPRSEVLMRYLGIYTKVAGKGIHTFIRDLRH
jgi:hypothetical protein